MIRFGPAGIPLSCKGRTLRDGIADLHHIGLTAMEVQFIKVNPLTRMVLDEEFGKLPRELVQQLVVGVGGTGGTPAHPSVAGLTQPIKRRDQLSTLSWSLAKDYPDLNTTKQLARALDVELTLHAPYYVDFFGSQEARERSILQLEWASVLAEGLGARLAVSHLGFYGGGPRADSVAELTEIAQRIAKWLHEYSHGTVRLGVEPSGHPDVFGSREEVLDLAHRVKGITPVLNLPHLAARERVSYDDPAILEPVLDEFGKATDGPLYLNFSGVEMYGPGEFRLTPIKRGVIKFDPLAELLGDRDYDVIVISSSPLLEHDAMYMKLQYERALARHWTKRHQAPAPATTASKSPARTPPRPTLRPKPTPPRKAKPVKRPPPRKRPKPRGSHARKRR